jgi:hypothetical protein
MALTDKLTNIADAIRSKTGNSDPLTLDAMPDAISGISGTSNTLLNSIIDGSVKTITSGDLSGVRTIHTYAFASISSLVSVDIPSNVTFIGGYAFRSCSSLSTVTIPNSVTYIGAEAFYQCTSLSSVVIPESITSLENGVFGRCSGLSSITIPASVTEIRLSAFFNCTDLTDVYYKGTEEQWNAITIGGNNEALSTCTIHYNS